MQGRVSRDSIQTLITGIDLIAHLRGQCELRKSGDHYAGKCPFHEDSTPSFHVWSDHFHCFGCNKHGNIVDYEMFRSGASFRETLVSLSERYSIALDIDDSGSDQQEYELRRRLTAIMEGTQQLFAETLAKTQGAAARDYLKKRGLTLSQIDSWRFGYAPRESILAVFANQRGWKIEDLELLGLVRKSQRDDGYYDFFRERVIVPIRDEQGRCVAFAGRLLESDSEKSEGNRGPKYINSPENPLYTKSKTLFNLDRARASISRRRDVVVVEGYMDCISLSNVGIENVVAVSGTAMGAEHLKKLARYASRAILCFDSDEAGQKAARRSFAALYPLNLLELTHIRVPDGKDPDVFIQKHGAQAFCDLVSRSQPLLQMVVESLRDERGTLEGWLRSVRSEVIPTVMKNPDPAQVDLALRSVGEFLGLSDPSILKSSLVGGGVRKEGSARGRESQDERQSESQKTPGGSLEEPKNEEQAKRLRWRIHSLFELRLALEVLFLEPRIWLTLGDEFAQRLHILQEKLAEVRDPSVGIIGFLGEILSRRDEISLSGALSLGSVRNEVFRALVAIAMKDEIEQKQLGIHPWLSEKEPPRGREVKGVDIFSGAGARLLNFVLSDVEGSARRESLGTQVVRTLSELERTVSWECAWRKARTAGQVDGREHVHEAGPVSEGGKPMPRT